MEDYYSRVAFDQASIAAEVIDGDRIAGYYATGEKDAYYEEIREYLLMVKQTVGLKYFYVVVPEDEVMVYIWDAGEPGEEGVCDLGDSDATVDFSSYFGKLGIGNLTYARDLWRQKDISTSDTRYFIPSHGVKFIRIKY